MKLTRNLFGLFAALAAGLAAPPQVQAQQTEDAARDYPSRVIRIVVPYGAGGSTDVLSRILAQKLTERLGRSVIVENRPGANGIIGTEAVARAPADGYTILMASNGQTVNVSLYPNLSYDIKRDFVPIVNVAAMPNVLVVHPSQPMKTVRDVIEHAKAKPGNLSYGHAGVGSAQHLAGEQFKLVAKVDIVQVAYKGGGPATADALAGTIPLLFAGLPAVSQHIAGGRLRAVAVMSAKRSPLLPEVPTVAETGLPGIDSNFWIALIGPRGIPPGIVQRLNKEVNAILTDPDTVKQFGAQGANMVGGSPADLDKFLQEAVESDAQIIRQANIKLDN